MPVGWVLFNAVHCRSLSSSVCALIQVLLALRGRNKIHGKWTKVHPMNMFLCCSHNMFSKYSRLWRTGSASKRKKMNTLDVNLDKCANQSRRGSKLRLRRKVDRRTRTQIAAGSREVMARWILNTQLIKLHKDGVITFVCRVGQSPMWDDASILQMELESCQSRAWSCNHLNASYPLRLAQLCIANNQVYVKHMLS